MKIILCIAICGALAGCVGAEQQPSVAKLATPYTGFTLSLGVVHDDARGVTCWYATGGYGGTSPALSCLPDSQIKAKQHEQPNA